MKVGLGDHLHPFSDWGNNLSKHVAWNVVARIDV